MTCNEALAPRDVQVLNEHTVALRATRSGNGGGRTYTLWLEAEDAAGNVSAFYPINVDVIHDQRNQRGLNGAILTNKH